MMPALLDGIVLHNLSVPDNVLTDWAVDIFLLATKSLSSRRGSTLMASVLAVHRSAQHTFSKETVSEIELMQGLGVRGDAHSGVTVQHRSRVAKDPSQPNLRQVHLIHQELLELLAHQGFDVLPGELGENITTTGLDLLELPVGTRLALGAAVITVTGLRNPCRQINEFQPSLLRQVLRHRDDGSLERLAGVMGIVSSGGRVQAGDAIVVTLPEPPHCPLTPV